MSYPETETKKAFAERIGVSQPRVSQLVKEGLPLSAEGRVLVKEGLAFYERRDPVRRQMAKPDRPVAAQQPKPQKLTAQAAPLGHDDSIDHSDQDPDGDIDANSLTEAKRLHEIEKLHRTRIAKNKDRGALVDRDLVRRGLHEFGMMQRDSWIAWCSRAAPDVAADLCVDLGKAFAVLNKLVRQQLIDMADAPLPPALKGIANEE